MIVAFTTLRRLDWAGWVLGIWSTAVSGGAGAVGTGFSTIMVDPDHFNINHGGFHHVMEAMAITFGISACVSLAKYLQTHPAPDTINVSSPGPITIKQTGTGDGTTETKITQEKEKK